jgi:hypothetical protein
VNYVQVTTFHQRDQEETFDDSEGKADGQACEEACRGYTSAYSGCASPRYSLIILLLSFSLKTLTQATEFTENTEKEMVIFMFYWLTQKVNQNFVITVCFSSVISVFSVAN